MTTAQSFLTSLLFLLLLSACGSNIVRESNSAQGKYKYGIALTEDERYEEALIELQEVKNKFPYSRYATLAKLAIADVHFRRESFIEAQSAYEVFKSLHPKNEQSDFVTYRLGMSFFMQLPSSIDRDLSIGDRALHYFDQLKRYYPNSKYVPEAEKKKAETLKMMAEKELYIANFYYKQKQYEAALKRYELAIQKFEGLGFDDQLLYGASSSSYRSGKKDKGQKYLAALSEKFPTSSFTQKMKQESSKYAK